MELRSCRARALFGSHIPVITGRFGLRISCTRSSYLSKFFFYHNPHSLLQSPGTIFRKQEVNPPVVTGICDPNNSRPRHLVV